MFVFSATTRNVTGLSGSLPCRIEHIGTPVNEHDFFCLYAMYWITVERRFRNVVLKD
jgi:hypothetical protein